MFVPKKKHSASQSGQVAVVVLLIMAVLLVLGLSLASQTTQEALISSQEEDTTRVFNAAETAVEEALSKLSKGETIANGSPVTVDAGSLPSNTSATYMLQASNSLEGDITQGMSATVFLDSTNYYDGMEIHWGTAADCNSDASLILSLYYADDGTANSPVTVKHVALKPKGCYSDANKAVGFTEGTNDVGTYNYKYTLKMDAAPWVLVSTNKPKMLRIKALYANTRFLIGGGIALPSHKDTINASATDTVNASGSHERRAIEVTRTKPAPPVLFDYALYSGGSLTK